MDDFSLDLTSAKPKQSASSTSEYHGSDRSKRWLSYSQVASYLKCNWAWFARYELRAQKPETPTAKALGDAIHRGIASVLLGGSIEEGIEQWYTDTINTVPDNLLWDDDGNIADRMRDTATMICHRTIAELSGQGWKVLAFADGTRAVELELSASLPSELTMWDGYAAHIDVILQQQLDGTNWIVDFKTRGKFHPDNSEEVNIQNLGYQYVCMQNGIPIAGTITYQMLNKPLARPKQNKDGSMSRTRIATDWSTYRDCLVEAGLNPEDYRDMQSKLDLEFFRPIKAYRSEEEVQNGWNRIILPAAYSIAKGEYPMRNMSHFNCAMCDVREVCLAAMRGHDPMPHLYEMQHDPEAVLRARKKGWL